MEQKPKLFPEMYPAKLKDYLGVLRRDLSTAGPREAYEALGGLKKHLSDKAGFGRNVKDLPPEHQEAAATFRRLRRQVAYRMEDADTWGQVAERERQLNAATSRKLAADKSFQKLFLKKVPNATGGYDWQADPVKLGSFIKKLGRAENAIKEQELQRFWQSADEYSRELETTARASVAGDYDAEAVRALNDRARRLHGEAVANAEMARRAKAAGQGWKDVRAEHASAVSDWRKSAADARGENRARQKAYDRLVREQAEKRQQEIEAIRVREEQRKQEIRWLQQEYDQLEAERLGQAFLHAQRIGDTESARRFTDWAKETPNG
jgi:hypothetical protein